MTMSAYLSSLIDALAQDRAVIVLLPTHWSVGGQGDVSKSDTSPFALRPDATIYAESGPVTVQGELLVVVSQGVCK